MKKIQRVHLIFVITLLIGNLIGIILSLVESQSFLQSISYYTLQSNILVFLFFSYLVFNPSKMRKLMNMKALVTITIQITFLVYHFILAPHFQSVPNFWSNFFVHTYTPLMVLLDYILFDPKGQLLYKKIPSWLSAPLIYYIYINVYALLGGKFVHDESQTRYPYFFINPDLIGWGHTILYVVGIAIFFSLFSFLFVFLDHRIQDPIFD